LISVVGVKYTTARDVAKKAVDRVCEKLRGKSLPSKTEQVRLYGGEIDRFEEFLTEAKRRKLKGLSPDIIGHLVYNYGSRYLDILAYIDEDPKWGRPIPEGGPVISAEVLHAVRQEMAEKLGDVILRRTELGSAGHPGEDCLKACANIMAAELGWDAGRVQREIEEVTTLYRPAS